MLVTSDPDSTDSLGYGRWVSGRGCSPGLGFLPSQALASMPALEQCLDRLRVVPEPEETITAPLDGRVSPDLLRHASRILAGGAKGR